MPKIKVVLSKTSIKRVLKDHCHHLLKYNIEDEHWLDYIAQTIIEHQNDILLFETKPDNNTSILKPTEEANFI